jgi:hypothetical protein
MHVYLRINEWMLSHRNLFKIKVQLRQSSQTFSNQWNFKVQLAKWRCFFVQTVNGIEVNKFQDKFTILWSTECLQLSYKVWEKENAYHLISPFCTVTGQLLFPLIVLVLWSSFTNKMLHCFKVGTKYYVFQYIVFQARNHRDQDLHSFSKWDWKKRERNVCLSLSLLSCTILSWQ